MIKVTYKEYKEKYIDNLEIDDDEIEIIDLESPYKHSQLGGGFGKYWDNEIYEKYREEIDAGLLIFDYFYRDNEKEKEVIQILEKSLENGKDFYTNATPRIKKEMEQLTEELNNRDVYF